MNRREFTRGVVALAAAPALPMPQLASAASTPGLPPQLVLLSEHHAARHGTASATLFARRMGISPHKAQALANRLLAKGLAVAPRPIKIVAPEPKLEALDKAKHHIQKAILDPDAKKPPPNGEGPDLDEEA